MACIYEDYRKDQLPNMLENITDKVELKGTSIGMKNVSISWGFIPSNTRNMKCISDFEGKIQGVLLEENVTASVEKLGSSFEQEFFYNPACDCQWLYKVFSYNYNDWIENVTVSDAWAIYQNIIGCPAAAPGLVCPFSNGYDKIAADVTGDGVVAMNDYAEVMALLKGDIQTFSYSRAPWRFVPEFVPQDYTNDFDNNPFNMNINGMSILNAQYTEPSFEFSLTANMVDKKGFDGVKLGDVTKAKLITTTGPPGGGGEERMKYGNSPIFVQDEEYIINLSTEDFSEVLGFQNGVNIDAEYFEILGVQTNNGSILNNSNFGMNDTENGNIRIVHLNPTFENINLADGTELFSINVRAKQSFLGIVDKIKLVEYVLPTEYINLNNEQQDVILWVNAESVTEERTIMTSSTNSSKPLVIYPNPATDKITLFFNSDGVEQCGSIKVFNYFGQLVKQLSCIEIAKGNNSIQIDASILNSGLNVVQLKDGHSIFQGKVLKK